MHQRTWKISDTLAGTIEFGRSAVKRALVPMAVLGLVGAVGGYALIKFSGTERYQATTILRVGQYAPQMPFQTAADILMEMNSGILYDAAQDNARERLLAELGRERRSVELRASSARDDARLILIGGFAPTPEMALRVSRGAAEAIARRHADWLESSAKWRKAELESYERLHADYAKQRAEFAAWPTDMNDRVQEVLRSLALLQIDGRLQENLAAQSELKREISAPYAIPTVIVEDARVVVRSVEGSKWRPVVHATLFGAILGLFWAIINMRRLL